MSGARNTGGRPQGDARQRLVQALGFSGGDAQALAQRTGLSLSKVRQTLNNLRASRAAQRTGTVPSPHRRRGRAVYGPVPADEVEPASLALARTICHAWR